MTIATDAPTDVNDTFRGGPRSVRFLGRINEASVAMLAEGGVIAAGDAAAIAAGILALAREDEGGPAQPSADYLAYEKRLAAHAGARASLVHAGRSRQDIASTLSRMNLRDDLVQAYEALLAGRDAVVEAAAGHHATIIPAYTHGVQAQPTTFGHYLLAFAAALDRQLERLREVHARLNRCPLGAAALSTSSFPVDRDRLARLLGFDGVVDNAYDANHWAPVDSCCELASVLQLCAVQLSAFAMDLHSQYAAPKPWLQLRAGELMGISSLMPQKRNPAALEQLRAQAALLLAEMQGPFLLAHNLRTGMFDYRSYDPLPSTRAVGLFGLFLKVVRGMVVDPAQALEEVDADYSTATEIADALMQDAGVPFRTGHHFASAIADLGRSRKVSLKAVPYEDAAALYREHGGADFPLSEAAWRDAIDPARMIARRRGRGGPQPAEMARMQAEAEARGRAARAWLDERRARLAAAEAGTRALVEALARTPTR